MTKDVLVSISGMHMGILADQEDEDEEIEVVTPASYYCRNGKHYIIYDEVLEGMAGTIRNKIRYVRVGLQYKGCNGRKGNV